MQIKTNIIKVGQKWRNKEKNYIIKVVSKDKKDLWKVSAHGKGRTTHGMTESSFHFYELVDQDNNVELTKEESMNITDTIRTLYNENIGVNHMFSVEDIAKLTIENTDKSVNEKLVSNIANTFIHRCVKENIIKNHSNKKKNSLSRKIFQKLKNTSVQYVRNRRPDVKIDNDNFIKVFNIMENGQEFNSPVFYEQVIMNTGFENIEDGIKAVIQSRIYKFISTYVKKGYIEREGKRFSTLTKLKSIEDGFSSKKEPVNVVETKKEPVNVVETKKEPVNIIETKEEPVNVVETKKEKPIENEKEIKEKLDTLTQKYKDLELKDLIENGIKFFNILLKKDKLHDSIISKLKQDQEDLVNKVNSRNKTIASSTKMIKHLNKENLKFDKDIEIQLEENEKLKLKNINLQNKTVQLEQKIKDAIPEETEAWKSLKLHEVMHVN